MEYLPTFTTKIAIFQHHGASAYHVGNTNYTSSNISEMGLDVTDEPFSFTTLQGLEEDVKATSTAAASVTAESERRAGAAALG